jgi:hypothetical protein
VVRTIKLRNTVRGAMGTHRVPRGLWGFGMLGEEPTDGATFPPRRRLISGAQKTPGHSIQLDRRISNVHDINTVHLNKTHYVRIRNLSYP